MVRCSIFYDKNLKEQLFMVRGDERYARSTKTTMTIGTPTLHSANFDLPITVNVFRDVDGASLIVYDNDDPLITIDDWQSTDSGRTITLNGLGYDADHNIYVRYIGNGKCSPSSSKTELINITNPYVFDATLDVTVPPIVEGSISDISITLSNDESATYNENQELLIYYDGNQIATETTDEYGEATTSVSNVGAIGLHELKIVFEGSLNLIPVTKTIPISVGYQLQVTDYPYIGVHLQDSTFKVKVTDFLNNPIANESVSMTSHFEGATYSFASATSNNQGIATLTGEINNTKCDGTFTISNESSESVELSNIRIVTVNGLTLTASSPRLYYGETSSINAEIEEPKLEGVPVIFSHWTTNNQNPTTETIYTNANGIATKNIAGTGTSAIRKYTADCGNNMTPVIELGDYYAYLSKVNENVTKGTFYMVYGNLISLQNTFRVDSTSERYATLRFNQYDFVKRNYSWKFQMEGVVSPSNVQIEIYPFTIPSRKYNNGKIIVSGYSTSLGRDDYVSYSVYENNSLISSGTEYISSGESITFRNGSANSQQVTFKKAWYQVDMW